MERRRFIQYGAITGTTVLFPQLLSSNQVTNLVKTAWYCSKLNPVRFVAGLVFDEISEVYLKPLVHDAFKSFINGKSVSKSSLTYYSSSSSSIRSSTIAHEPYKASVAIYGVVDYEKYKRDRIRLALKMEADLDRFKDICQFLKDEKVELKLYDLDIPFLVGNDLEPNELFNIDYIKFPTIQDKESYYQQLLKITNNQAYMGLAI